MQHYIESNDNVYVPGQAIQQPDEVDIILLHIPKDEKELLSNIKATFRSTGDLDLTRLIQTLKGMDYPVEMNMIFYYSQTSDMYIYCGKEPLQINTTIPAHEIVTSNDRKQITLRIRQIEHTTTPKLDPILEMETAALLDA
jgi:hypothetical protein